MRDPKIDPNDRGTWPEPEPDPLSCRECGSYVPEDQAGWCEECGAVGQIRSMDALCPEHAVRQPDGTVLCRRHAGKG